MESSVLEVRFRPSDGRQRHMAGLRHLFGRFESTANYTGDFVCAWTRAFGFLFSPKGTELIRESANILGYIQDDY